MFSNADFRKQLIVSLITSILVLIFIEPLLKWLTDGLMWLGLNISASFTKTIYTSAALGFREKNSFLLLMFITSLLIGIMAGMASAKLFLGQSVKRELPLRAKLLSVLMGLAFLVANLDVLAINFAELQLNTSFNQRITVLSPKVSDQEIKVLKAKWALMKGRSDYEAINFQMDALARTQGINLPSPLWE